MAPPTALAGRRVVGAMAEMESQRPSGGLGNSMLSKLFSRVEKGGPAAEGRVDTMANMGATSGSARRASRMVRPGGVTPAPLQTITAATATSGQQKEAAHREPGVQELHG